MSLAFGAAVPAFIAPRAAGTPGEVLRSAHRALSASSEFDEGSIRSEVAHLPLCGVRGCVGSNEGPIRGCVSGVDPAKEVFGCVILVQAGVVAHVVDGGGTEEAIATEVPEVLSFSLLEIFDVILVHEVVLLHVHM